MKKTKIVIAAIALLIIFPVYLVSCYKGTKDTPDKRKDEKISLTKEYVDFSIKEKALLQTFFWSKEFNRERKMLLTLGSINVEKTLLDYVDGNIGKPVFTLILEEKGITKANLIFIPLNKSVKKDLLPNNDRYAIVLFKINAQNESSRSVELRDLNWENEKVADIYIEKGKSTIFKKFQIPTNLRSKYRNTGVGAVTSPRATHFCDKNSNGDVSFGECWNCISDAISQNPTSTTICQMASVSPLIIRIFSSCEVSVAAACVYISARWDPIENIDVDSTNALSIYDSILNNSGFDPNDTSTVLVDKSNIPEVYVPYPYVDFCNYINVVKTWAFAKFDPNTQPEDPEPYNQTLLKSAINSFRQSAEYLSYSMPSYYRNSLFYGQLMYYVDYVYFTLPGSSEFEPQDMCE